MSREKKYFLYALMGLSLTVVIALSLASLFVFGGISDLSFRDGDTPESDLPAKQVIVDIEKEDFVLPAKKTGKSLDDLVPAPINPIRADFFEYPKYDIVAPLIYSEMTDYFEVGPDGEVDYNRVKDMSDPSSSLQKKLEQGVVHIAFTPQPGEVGNSYLLGHSSNYDYVQSDYNEVFKPLVHDSVVGDKFLIYDKDGRRLRFRVFEVLEIHEDEVGVAFGNYSGRRVVTVQTTVMKTGQPTHRWLTRGELVVE